MKSFMICYEKVRVLQDECFDAVIFLNSYAGHVPVLSITY
jgi:hypothetical protein